MMFSVLGARIFGGLLKPDPRGLCVLKSSAVVMA